MLSIPPWWGVTPTTTTATLPRPALITAQARRPTKGEKANRFPGSYKGTLTSEGGLPSAFPPMRALKTEAARCMGLTARLSISSLTRGRIPQPRSPSSTPSIRRSRCVSHCHVSPSPLTGSPFLSCPARPPLAGRRPAHGSRCPLEADHGMALGSIPCQSEDVNSHPFTVSSKTQYLCARTGAQRYWPVRVK